jgi:hypothetical protein
LPYFEALTQTYQTKKVKVVLVSLDFPWDPGRWDDPQKGYTRTRDFFVFKQYSAFIHPGWQRVGTTLPDGEVAGVTFMSPCRDSAAFVGINRSQTDSLALHLSVPGYIIDTSIVYRTSEEMDCEAGGGLSDSVFVLPPRSIGTVSMELSRITGELEIAHAGPDQDVCGRLEVTLAGNEPVLGTGTWTQVSGPGTVTFGDEHAHNTIAAVDSYGTYVLEWEIVNGTCATQDQVEIRFEETSSAQSCEGFFASVKNFPDPFSDATRLRFFLRKGGKIILSVYDCTGREVRRLDLGTRQPGPQEYTLQRGGMKIGLYFFRLDHSSGSFIHGRLMVQ